MSHNLTDLEAAEAFYLIAAKRDLDLAAVSSADFNLFEHTPVAIEALRAVNPAKAADLERAFVVFLAAQRAKTTAEAALNAATTAADAEAADAVHLAADAEARRTFNLFYTAFAPDAPAGDLP